MVVEWRRDPVLVARVVVRGEDWVGRDVRGLDEVDMWSCDVDRGGGPDEETGVWIESHS